MDEKRKSNVLNHAKSAQLYALVSGDRAWYADATAQQCAVRAADQLGFDVTANNVLSVKRALGITKPAPVAPAGECRCKELAAVLYRWFMEPTTPTLENTIIAALRSIAGVKPPATEPLPFRKVSEYSGLHGIDLSRPEPVIHGATLGKVV